MSKRTSNDTDNGMFWNLDAAEASPVGYSEPKADIGNFGQHFVCPITLAYPVVPVTAADGRVYERAAIEQHINQHAGVLKSPVYGVPMGRALLDAPHIKSAIEDMVRRGLCDAALAVQYKAEAAKKECDDTLKRAEEGDLPSMIRVAMFYKMGSRGLKKDLHKSLHWYKLAYTPGDVDLAASLGTAMLSVIYDESAESYCTTNLTSKGLMYLGIAASQGSKLAAFKLGIILAEGQFGVNQDRKEAVYWLEKALSKDCPVHRLLGDEEKENALVLLGLLEMNAHCTPGEQAGHWSTPQIT
jgi:hypothetical protein